MGFELAQINIGRLVAPIDDPRIAGFVAELNSINSLAEEASGFVWRLKSDSGNATDIPYSDEPFVMVNMSVWKSVEALRDFTYATRHLEIFRERARWFEKMAKPHYCLWWVEADFWYPAGLNEIIPRVCQPFGNFASARCACRCRNRIARPAA